MTIEIVTTIVLSFSPFSIIPKDMHSPAIITSQLFEIILILILKISANTNWIFGDRRK